MSTAPHDAADLQDYLAGTPALRTRWQAAPEALDRRVPAVRRLLMGALVHVNAGPLARLQEVIADPNVMSVIVQRVTDADTPETLKDIARSWKVPLGKLAEWITEDRERTEQYANALRIAAEQHALETIAIVDAATPEDVAVAKLRADTRFRLAAKLAREKFGEMNEVRVSGSVSLISVLSSLPRGNVIDITPQTEVPKKIPEKKEDFTI